MRFFTTVLAAAAVSAADIAYKVGNFGAACLPHGAQCRVSFNIWQYGGFETPPGVACEAFSQVRADGTMTDVENGKCEGGSPRTFNLTRGADGATLWVSGPVTPSTDLTGKRLLPARDWVFKEDNKAKIQTYVGPTNLGLEAVWH